MTRVSILSLLSSLLTLLSPPFGGTATSEMPDVPSLSLRTQQHSRPVLSTNPSARQQGPARTASNTSQTISNPEPVSSGTRETPSKAISSLKSIQPPTPPVPITSDDELLLLDLVDSYQAIFSVTRLHPPVLVQRLLQSLQLLTRQQRRRAVIL